VVSSSSTPGTGEKTYMGKWYLCVGDFGRVAEIDHAWGQVTKLVVQEKNRHPVKGTSQLRGLYTDTAPMRETTSLSRNAGN